MLMMVKIVVIGGGTGSSIVLKGLKKYEECELFAIVPMGDSGGSTGKLREEFGILSAGEIRQRLVALASEENDTKEFIKLLDYRFEQGKELKGQLWKYSDFCTDTISWFTREGDRSS